MNILIVGAGITGATAAALLCDKNNIDIIDSSDHIAGNCFDYRDENGIMIHKYGSHIFHTSHLEVWNFLSQYTDFNTYMHKVVGLVDGVEVPIPFNFNTIRKIFPESLANTIEKKLLERYDYDSKIPIMDFMNQNDSELRFLANYIYKNVFLHYTEKQWGNTPDEVDGTVTSRVPVYLSKDDRYFQDIYQGIPLDGYTSMIEKMLNSPHINIKLNTLFNISMIDSYDLIIYTGSIDELFSYCFGCLPYRSVNFKFEIHDCDYYQSNAVINYPNNYDFTRIHEYKYYLNDKTEKTVIAKEYSEDFIVGKNQRFYPIPSDENIHLYNKYLKHANQKYPNIVFLGRLGDYKYYDMDKAILRVINFVKEKF